MAAEVGGGVVEVRQLVEECSLDVVWRPVDVDEQETFTTSELHVSGASSPWLTWAVEGVLCSFFYMLTMLDIS